MNQEHEQSLIEQLAAVKPSSILLVAPSVSTSLMQHFSATSDLVFDHVVFESIAKSIAPLGQYDFVIVADTLEHLETGQAEQLISRLRDLHAKLLWAIIPAGGDQRYNRKNAVAQGMRMVSPENFGAGNLQWYEFSLQFYKPVPQWLNARNWANPERWEKSRW